MAVITCRPWLLLLLLLLYLAPPLAYSQSDSPQNIETFYPNSAFAPPVTPPTASPSNEESSDGKSIVKAVLITAASTAVIAVVFFFLLRKCVVARRRRDRVADQNAGDSSGPSPLVAREDFSRFNGNIKGLIIDEDGLDVLYWRKLQRDRDRDRQSGEFRKEVVSRVREEDEREKKIVYDKEEKADLFQEVPLLRGKSSTSQSTYHNCSQANDANSENRWIQTSKTPSSTASLPLPSPSPPPTPQPQAPPPPLRSSPPPPPPPPRTVAALSTTTKPPPPPKGSSVKASSSDDGQVKLKPLHWDKVNPDSTHSMVWDKIDRGSFTFDGDLMEALFGYVATNKKSPRDEKGAVPGPNLPPQTNILEPRKSQNTAIVLKSLGISRKNLINILLEGHEISGETVEKLSKIAPTPEEQTLILEFNGDPNDLAEAEMFLFYLLRAVPSAFTRLQALLFKANYYPEISHHKEGMKILDLACQELRARGLFVKLLEAILKAGNRMNAGTARGNAQAFNLKALRKLSDVKSMDGKTTLLHFVVEEVVRSEGKRCVMNRHQSLNHSPNRNYTEGSNWTNDIGSSDDKERDYIRLGLPVVGGLSSKYSNVTKAASIDFQAFSATCMALTARTKDTKRALDRCGDDVEGGFAKRMKAFLESAEEDLEAARKEETKVMEFVRKTTEYYQSGAMNDRNPFQLFVIIKDFLGMVDEVCIDIAKNVQKRRTPTSTSSPARNAVKFPILPPNFMADKSSSNSSSSEPGS